MLTFNLGYFCLLTITSLNIDACTGGHSPIIGGSYCVVEIAPLPLAIGSNFKMFDLDEDNKVKANVVAHDIIVSLVGDILHW